MEAHKFHVTVYGSNRYYKREMAEYIREAVEMWKGQFGPDSALFRDNIKVTVKPVKEAA